MRKIIESSTVVNTVDSNLKVGTYQKLKDTEIVENDDIEHLKEREKHNIENSGIVKAEPSDLEVKCLNYVKYLFSHINLVIKYYYQFIMPIKNRTNISKYYSDKDYKEAVDMLGKHIHEHDKSKLDKEEFYAYREHWQPTLQETNDIENKELNDKAYNLAWTHHSTVNPHHPSCIKWKNTDMELQYILEMICDWMSVSQVINGDYRLVTDWWENKAGEERQAMSEHTINVVNELLFDILKDDLKM